MADCFDLLMNGVVFKSTIVLRESTHMSPKFYCIHGMGIAKFLFLINNYPDFLIYIAPVFKAGVRIPLISNCPL